MKNLPSIVAAVILVTALLLYACSFQLRSTEVAVVKTFGKAEEKDVITEPGLKFKWPIPIQTVVKYDKRLRVMVDRTEETRTSDSKNVILTTFATWTIDDPYKFTRSYPTEEAGRDALRLKVRAHKLAVTGKHTFAEFVSTDPKERRLTQIEQEMAELVRAEAAESSGWTSRCSGSSNWCCPKRSPKPSSRA